MNAEQHVHSKGLPGKVPPGRSWGNVMQTTGWQPRSAQSFMITRVLSGFVKLTANVCIHIYSMSATLKSKNHTTFQQQQGNNNNN